MKVVARISNGRPPAWPLPMVRRASRCSADAFSSTKRQTVPLPSWIAPGHFAAKPSAEAVELERHRIRRVRFARRPCLRKIPWSAARRIRRGSRNRSCRIGGNRPRKTTSSWRQFAPSGGASSTRRLTCESAERFTLPCGPQPAQKNNDATPTTKSKTHHGITRFTSRRTRRPIRRTRRNGPDCRRDQRIAGAKRRRARLDGQILAGRPRRSLFVVGRHRTQPGRRSGADSKCARLRTGTGVGGEARDRSRAGLDFARAVSADDHR